VSNNTCSDCDVNPGERHLEGCDVALCKKCGHQLLSCDHIDDSIELDTIWTGEWPGKLECRELGWYARWTIVTECSRDGRPDSGPERRCNADDLDAHLDLNRLGFAGHTGELVWNKQLERWVRPVADSGYLPG
jgi:hypothetical protein